MSTTILHRDDRGEVRVDGNELFIEDRTSGDPVAICLHSNNETIGKLSFRAYINGAWREVGFVGFGRDERGRTDLAHRDALEVEFWTHKPNEGFEDANYKRMFTIRHDGITFDGGNSGVMPKKIALRAEANGQFVCAEGAGSQPLIANRAGAGPWETFEVVVIE